MGYASDGYEGGTMSDVADMGKYQSQPKNKIKTDPVVKPETKEQYMARKDATRKDANR